MSLRRDEEIPKVDLVDLRSITRNAKNFLTSVSIYMNGFTRQEWILAGEAEHQEHSVLMTHTIGCRLKDGVTDFEHDSAWGFKLPLIGFEFQAIWNHVVMFNAFIDSRDPKDFRVPNPGYDPIHHPESVKCKHCTGEDKGHIILPPGFYVPEANQELFEKVRGKRVQITIGPNWRDKK